jgi:hypothetical protein
MNQITSLYPGSWEIYEPELFTTTGFTVEYVPMGCPCPENGWTVLLLFVYTTGCTLLALLLILDYLIPLSL